MATTPEVKKVTLNINGQDFTAVEKQYGGRSQKKEQPYLQIELPDWAAVTRFASVVGQAPLTQLVARAFNSEIVADATNAAFTKDAAGVWQFDRNVAARELLSAASDTLRQAKDEIKEQLAAAREDFNKAMGEVLALAAKNQPVTPALLNKAQTLQINVAKLEAKLVKKPKAEKETKAAAPAAK